ncbi:UvrD-helicase domain-containing protein [Conexibacter sp. CPCC 206217]|uniref:UvrD-helicase domain-containing protein n=1 Tax=Conexibacter sp. CPCC 206217 TaxID=3064574 RepID=UPI002718C303|nr:ATP-dependent helicase [Conexibacter sp. CPCC 206217]MDO8209646.1 ATP-dependent helicase [Conexibacter sp. CPCC 206217]
MVSDSRSKLQVALDELTEQQRAAVVHPGNFTLAARPGSGKTRTVALRLAHAARDGERRIAVASYTNVAVDEVREVCRQTDVVLGREHFVDTLHRFLNTYVLRPFGHLVCDYRKRLRIRGPDWDQDANAARGWKAVILNEEKTMRLSVAHFHFDRNGNALCHSRPSDFHYMDLDEINEKGAAQARQLKTLHARSGVVSHSDALYWALQVLRGYPRIARAIAGRFDEIIIDEAQDTSDVQLACLEALMDTGKLKSLVTVADPEQSIYAFQGADPERFQEFASARGLDELNLTANFRSSQLICDVAHRFTQRPHADIAKGPNAACDVPPEIYRYDRDRPAAAVEQFHARLALHGLDPAEAVVVVRAARLADTIEGRISIDSHRVLRALGRFGAASSTGKTLSAADVRAVEDALLWLIRPELNYDDLPHDKQRKLRLVVGRLRTRLPPLKGPLGEWSAACRPHVVTALTELGVRQELAHKPRDVLKNLPKYKTVQADAHFVAAATSPPVHTVHAVKGRSIESVLLIVEGASRSGRTDQASLLSAIVAEEHVDPSEREELRIGFVSVSRAKRYCAVALPDSVAEDVFTRYLTMGFHSTLA